MNEWIFLPARDSNAKTPAVKVYCLPLALTLAEILLSGFFKDHFHHSQRAEDFNSTYMKECRSRMDGGIWVTLTSDSLNSFYQHCVKVANPCVASMTESDKPTIDPPTMSTESQLELIRLIIPGTSSTNSFCMASTY